MTLTQISTQDLIKEFSKATINGDILAIEKILDDDGIFEIQDVDLELRDKNKHQFLEWFGNQLSKNIVEESTFDQCIGCSFGKNIVLFNGGYFPKTQKEVSDREKIAFMIDSKEGKINKIQFCSVFLKIDNKYIFECIGKIILEDMKKGFTMGQSIKNFDTSKDYDHYKFPTDIIDESVYENNEMYIAPKKNIPKSK